jgi:hypothetical protein
MKLKFDRAWTIDKSKFISKELNISDIRLNTHGMIAGFRRGIADGIARGNRPLAGHGVRACQNGLEKSRLTAQIRSH